MGLLHKLLRSGQRPGRHQGGFTLAELMMVIAIIGILSAIGIPAMVSTYPDYQLKAAARDIVSNFQKAKLEAAKRNTWVTVTFNQPVNGITYDYVVFVDSNQNHQFDAAADTALAQTDFSGYGGGVTMVSNTFGLNADATPLPCFTFTPRGLPKGNNDLATTGTVRLTNRKGVGITKYDVTLNTMGGFSIVR